LLRLLVAVYFKAETYFNRGVVKLILDQNNGGLLDLYKAKFYGEEDAEWVIKKYGN